MLFKRLIPLPAGSQRAAGEESVMVGGKPAFHSEKLKATFIGQRTWTYSVQDVLLSNLQKYLHGSVTSHRHDNVM